MEFRNSLTKIGLGLSGGAGCVATKKTECITVAVADFAVHGCVWWRGIGALAAVILSWFFAAGLAVAQSPAPAKGTATTNIHELRGGWYPWDPYQYADYRRGEPVLTGFDVEIERALAHLLGIDITLPQIPVGRPSQTTCRRHRRYRGGRYKYRSAPRLRDVLKAVPP